MSDMLQIPAPGTRKIAHCGDIFSLRLQLSGSRHDWDGYVRTNLGNAGIRWQEIIARVEKGAPCLHHDWQDLPMQKIGEGLFEFSFPLSEVGRFEVKAFALPPGESEPVWPEGDNVVLKVEPACAYAANTIYCAFVRQFGEQRRYAQGQPPEDALVELESSGFAVLPPSGRFRDLAGELDHIMGAMGFRMLQLLPIHPTPTTYARMGRFGSPYASLDYEEVDTALAEFDRKSTPLDQFRELVDGVHRRGGLVMLDIPINHTGWASRLQVHHPEWFARDGGKHFASPGAWGVTWEDLSKLDYSRRELWFYMADMFLYWCRQGVNGFRCDAGYKVPLPVWEYIVAKVRNEFPDTLFLLEGLGGRLEVVNELLDRANLNWAYSELFQNYSREQIAAYLPESARVSTTQGLYTHFAETHDNLRLAATSHAYARMRVALCALCSDSGAFGITNGVEWFAEERVEVHRARTLNWGSRDNQVALIARLNFLLSSHPCFRPGAGTSLVQAGQGNGVALLRRSGEDALLVLANLDHEHPLRLHWQGDSAPFDAGSVRDLLSDREVTILRDEAGPAVELAPAEVMCLSASAESATGDGDILTERRVRFAVTTLMRRYGVTGDDHYVSETASQFQTDPESVVRSMAGTGHSPVILWNWDADVRRIVSIPPGFLLMVEAPCSFRCLFRDAAQVRVTAESLPSPNGHHFALVVPPPGAGTYSLEVSAYEPGEVRHAVSSVQVLESGLEPVIRKSFDGPDAVEKGLYAVTCNEANAFCQMRAAWACIESQYDALLSANLHNSSPVDRQVLFTRCRGWVVYRGYSCELRPALLKRFKQYGNADVEWQFEVPVGSGLTVTVHIRHRLAVSGNAIRLEVMRVAGKGADHLDDKSPVRVILRPDVEDRIAHGKTKAYTGPEGSWPAAVTPRAHGFTFSPGGVHGLDVSSPSAGFVFQPEWLYMVGHPHEAGRGLGADSDLFSPGYFEAMLCAGEQLDLHAAASGESGSDASFAELPASDTWPDTEPALDALASAMRIYIVKRDDLKTVIAGFPWFLDWGRDTLICLRGLIAAGWREEAATILKRFARFEYRGTLPNVLYGETVGNRDTSDAPLWFIVACSELCAQPGMHSLLEHDCGGRSLREVLNSIASGYLSGTPNGISVDPETGLVFSPSHFTWMDTNHPAGTPREGYPVEIQALSIHALRFLASAGGEEEDWAGLANRAAASLRELYVRPGEDSLSDCLHAQPGQGARTAQADDCVRSNQLLAITLGALEDPELCRSVLRACERLLVPGGIRSLADQPVTVPVPVEGPSGLLNDPLRPYWGHYEGDEDTRRKPAYHNGTAWSWPFPSYCEAMAQTYGPEARDAALALLAGFVSVADTGCIGQIPEIMDGNAPHRQRGCGAQAWGVTEAYRVLAFLKNSL